MKTTYSKAVSSRDNQDLAHEAATADARVLLPWSGDLRSSSERRAIVRAAHPEWSREYQELVVGYGDQ